jgi:hypothetical protein
VLIRNQLIRAGYEHRLCPLHLWDVPSNLGLYPDLFPAGTLLILDSQPSSHLYMPHRIPQMDISLRESTWSRPLSINSPGTAADVQVWRKLEGGNIAYADYYCGQPNPDPKYIERQDIVIVAEGLSVEVVGRDYCIQASGRLPMLGSIGSPHIRKNVSYYLSVIPRSNASLAEADLVLIPNSPDRVRASQDSRRIPEVTLSASEIATLQDATLCQHIEASSPATQEPITEIASP